MKYPETDFKKGSLSHPETSLVGDEIQVSKELRAFVKDLGLDTRLHDIKKNMAVEEWCSI